MIEAALREVLLTDASVSTLIGSRMFPLRLPQEVEFPALVYQRITTPRIRSHLGTSNLASPTFQITCNATQQEGGRSGYDLVKSLATAVRSRLEGLTGTFAGVEIQNTMVIDDRDDVHPERDLQRVLIDVTIWHREV